MRHYLQLEIRRSLRDQRFLLLVVGWPVGAYLLFSIVFGGGTPTEGLQPRTEIMVAMACFGAIGAVLTATGPRLADDRRAGWLRQLRLTPLAPSRILAARVLAAVALTVPAVALTFVAAATVNDVRMPLLTWAELGALICAGAVAFAALGTLIGAIAGEGATGLTMIVYLVLSALGGLWMPVAILPSAMQTVAKLLPSNGIADLAWAVAAQRALPLSGLVVLLAWFVATTLLATVAVRRVAGTR